MPSRKALVRRPSPRLAEGLVTHVEREEVDVDLAVEQWEAYGEALRDHGWETIEVDPADDCPDSVFVEDTVVMYKNVALIARPGAESRRAETDGDRGGRGRARLLGELGLGTRHPGGRRRPQGRRHRSTWAGAGVPTRPGCSSCGPRSSRSGRGSSPCP